jgi:hypothetical protein
MARAFARWLNPSCSTGAKPLRVMTNSVRESPSEQTKACCRTYHDAWVKGDAEFVFHH